MYSLQRRRERYRIIYTWKVLENLVPNVNNKIKSKDHIRLGRMCLFDYHRSDAQKFREGSFTVNGPRLFNSIPKSIRNLKGVPLSNFKRALDAYLTQVPDEPQLPGYTERRRANTNELFEMNKNMCCRGFPSILETQQPERRVAEAADMAL